MAKTKIAVFDFTGCEGCQLQILNCEDELLSLLEHVEIVNFREATSRRDEDYDVALIDGGIATEKDIRRIKKIREKAKILVTIGSCSSTGGINCLRNDIDNEVLVKEVYGEEGRHFRTIDARPISAVVKVDLAIPGCPVSRKELTRCLLELLSGKMPEIPNYSVCMECKLKENECLLEKNMMCLGPITRAGCEARCPSFKSPCEGCRGKVKDPNVNGHIEILKKNGLEVDEVLKSFKLFAGYSGTESSNQAK